MPSQLGSCLAPSRAWQAPSPITRHALLLVREAAPSCFQSFITVLFVVQQIKFFWRRAGGGGGGGRLGRGREKREGEKTQITAIRAKRLNEFLSEHRLHLSWREASGQEPTFPSSLSLSLSSLSAPSSPSKVTCGLRLSRPLLRVQAEKKKQLIGLGGGGFMPEQLPPQIGSTTCVRAGPGKETLDSHLLRALDDLLQDQMGSCPISETVHLCSEPVPSSHVK